MNAPELKGISRLEKIRFFRTFGGLNSMAISQVMANSTLMTRSEELLELVLPILKSPVTVWGEKTPLGQATMLRLPPSLAAVKRRTRRRNAAATRVAPTMSNRKEFAKVTALGQNAAATRGAKALPKREDFVRGMART